MQPSKTHSFIRFARSWDLDNDTWFILGQCKSLISSIWRTPIMPRYRDEIYSVSLIKGAQATTAIEGNTLSEDEVRQINEGKSLKKESKQYMEQEVKNVLEALNILRNQIVSNESIQLLTPHLIRKFHEMIGRDLGDNFEAIPGQFRRNEVTVGSVYRAPSYTEVDQLMDSFCIWSKSEFHYEQGQNFSTAIIQAIVTHVYIAWIHPFGDGNGRTARLIEFYLLLRAGVPDIAAHVLSNFYNETRSEYYRQLTISSKNGGDLTSFVKYAINGFKDGLKVILEKVNLNQLEIAWRNYVHEVMSSEDAPKTPKVKKRQLSLILSMKLEIDYTETGLLKVNDAIAVEYSGRSRKTFNRDLQSLLAMGLLSESEAGYRANTAILQGIMAKARDHKSESAQF